MDVGRARAIPLDIVEYILEGMPPKDVGCFRCVSTYWRSTLSSPAFISAYFKKMKHLREFHFIHKVIVSDPPISYMFLPRNNPQVRREFFDDHEDVEVLCSYNSLILISNTDDSFFLKNPCTEQSLLIPNETIVFPRPYSEAWVYFGLGYDQMSNDYLVMRVSRFFEMEGYDAQVRLFSRNLNSWMNIPSFPKLESVNDNACFVGGMFHWKVKISPGVCEVVTFNVTGMRYDVVALPEFSVIPWFLSMEALDDNI